MASLTRRFVLGVAVLGLMAGTAGRARAEFQYLNIAAFTGINDAGQVTGYTHDLSSGFVREVDGTITTISIPGAYATLPLSIDSAGRVAGYFYDGIPNAGGVTHHSFLRDPDGTIEFIDLPSTVSTAILDINDAGQLLMFDYDNGHYGIRDPDGTFAPITEGPPNASSFSALNINNTGYVLGGYNETILIDNTYYTANAYYIRNNLGEYITFSGTLSSTVFSEINDAGLAVGASASNGFGVVWDQQAGYRELAVPGATVTRLAAINNHGQVVGTAQFDDGSLRGFTANITDLETPTPVVRARLHCYGRHQRSRRPRRRLASQAGRGLIDDAPSPGLTRGDCFHGNIAWIGLAARFSSPAQGGS